MEVNMKLYKGLVTHVIDPNNFWMRIGTEHDMNIFDEYQQLLNDFCNGRNREHQCNIDHLCPENLVVVAHSTEGFGASIDSDQEYRWERAQVARVDVENKTADVFFVDLGFTSIVSVCTCQDIPLELFQFLAPQARRVSLTGIKPLSKSWTSRASSSLQDLTNKQDILTFPVQYDETSRSCHVIIYTRLPHGLWQSLIHAMQEEELGLITDGSIEEFLTEDIVQQCLLRHSEHLNNQNDAEARLCTGAEASLPEETTFLTDTEAGLPAECYEDSETEIWDDDPRWTGDTEDYNQSATATMQLSQDPLTSDKQEGGVTGFDYRTLQSTKMVCISQMQQMKDLENQKQNKSKLKQGLEGLEVLEMHHDDQDWDAVRVTDDYLTDIKSQIYHGIDRQHSDEGLNEILAWSKTISSPKKSKSAVYEKPSPNPVKEEVTEDFDVHIRPLNEIESYELEKQIKQILMNLEEKESDYICASVYSVVEPDVDIRSDQLQVVICAILEYAIENSCQHLEVAFAILEAYSDAVIFGDTMVEVIQGLKQRFVRKHQSVRHSNDHKEFSKMIACVFRQAEEWSEHICKVVRGNVISMIERWIVFNRQRKNDAPEAIESELIYLECVETFLSHCSQLVASQYETSLKKIMKEIRFKLVEDGTPSSIRSFLLDMLITLTVGQTAMQMVTNTISAATQTEQGLGEVRQRVERGQEAKNVETINTTTADMTSIQHQHTDPDQHFSHTTKVDSILSQPESLPLSFPNKGPSQRKKRVARNLPPRLVKKLLQQQQELSSKIPSDISTNTYFDDTQTLKPASECRSPFTITDSASSPTIYNQPSSRQQSPQTSRLTYSPVNVASKTSSISSVKSISPVNSSDKFCSISNVQGLNVSASKAISSRSSVVQTALSSDFSSRDPSLSVISPIELNTFQSALDTVPSSDKTMKEEFNLVRNDEMKYFSKMDHFSSAENRLSVENDVDLNSSDNKKSVKNQTKFCAIDNLEVETPNSPTKNSEEFKAQVFPNELTTRNEQTEAVNKESDLDCAEGDELNKDEVQMTGGGSGSNGRVIRYTSQQLKDLNPFQDQPKIPIWDLWEPKDVLDQMIVMVNPGRADLQERGSKSGHWSSGANEFPPSSRTGTKKSALRNRSSHYESSVDPDPVLGEMKSDGHSFKNFKDCDVSNFESNNHNSVEVSDGIVPDRSKTSDSLASIAMELFNSNTDSEMWHEDSLGPNGDFLKHNKDHDFPTSESRKSKKKRGRGKPLDEFLQKQADMKLTAEDDNDDDYDFSPEAFQMYEELEQQGVGIDLDSEMPSTSRFGSGVFSSSKRPSLFASVRSEQPAAERKPWCPGKRFCTKCGCPDHLVYDCPSQASRLLQ